MQHKQIYEIFKSYFPKIAEDAEVWFANGRNSIRIRKKNKEEFIFSYKDRLDWSFETVDRHLANMNKNKRSG